MRFYALHGLTRYAASVVARELTPGEQVELLRANQDDPAAIEVALRALVAKAAGSAPEADAEFVASALDAIDWPTLITSISEQITVTLRLPCGHEEKRFQSFGGYDARHGERGTAREAVETFECACGTCGEIYDILLTSQADGLDLRRRLVFTTRPKQAVYVERLQFNPGDELPKCSSGQWKQGSPYRQRVEA